MFENAEWLFFDLDSTLIDEHTAYERRLKGIADQANVPYEEVCRIAVGFYKPNKKGDLETAKLFGVELPRWYTEGEILYDDAAKSLEILGKNIKLVRLPTRHWALESVWSSMAYYNTLTW